MEEASDKYKQTTIEEMSVAPAPATVANSENIQAGLPKNMVLDLNVVATTCHSRTNDLTTSKALQWAIK